MERYADALQAVGDVLRIYAPHPELVPDSLELEEAVHAAVTAGGGEGRLRETMIEDLSRLAHEVFPADAMAAASVAHSMKRWAKDASS